MGEKYIFPLICEWKKKKIETHKDTKGAGDWLTTRDDMTQKAINFSLTIH